MTTSDEWREKLGMAPAEPVSYPWQGAQYIRRRQLDASRRELHSMTDEINVYGESFTGPQLVAMRNTMRALKALISALEADQA